MSSRVSIFSSRYMESPEAEATVGRVILSTWMGLEFMALAALFPREGVAVVIRVLP